MINKSVLSAKILHCQSAYPSLPKYYLNSKILLRAYSLNINNKSFIFPKIYIYLLIKMNKFLLELHLASSGSKNILKDLQVII